MICFGAFNFVFPLVIGHVGGGGNPSATLKSVFLIWEADWTIVLPLTISAAIYLNGWLKLQKKGVQRFTKNKLWFFLAAMAALYLALQSPIDTLADDYLLSMHMVQHLFLWFIVPLLVWISEPFAPFMLGVPNSVRRYILSPLMKSNKVRWFFSHLTHPVTAWLTFVINMWIWHLPLIYDWALHYQIAHDLEHTTFLATGLVFWWPIIRPYPSNVKWTQWLLLPYLMLAGVQGTFISAIILFSPHVIYTFYLNVPRITSVTPLADQQIAGAIMWIPGSIVYLAALTWVARGLLSDRGGLGRRGTLAIRRNHKIAQRPHIARKKYI